jgi:hypothetical protein
MLVNFHEKSVNSPHIVLSDANFERKCGDNNIRFSDMIFYGDIEWLAPKYKEITPSNSNVLE